MPIVKSPLNGYHFRVAGNVDVSKTTSSNSRYIFGQDPLKPENRAGRVVDVFGFIAEAVNFTYEIVPYKSKDSLGYFNKSSGKWNYALGLVDSGEADTVLSFASASKDRENDFQNTYPPLRYYVNDLIEYSPLGEEEGEVKTDVLDSVNSMTWWMMFLVFSSFLVLWFVESMIRSGSCEFFKVLRVAEFMIGKLTGSGPVEVEEANFVIKFYKFIWCVLSLVFVAYFRASSATSFTVGSAWKQPFSSVIGMLDSDYNFLLFRGSGKIRYYNMVSTLLETYHSPDQENYLRLVERSINLQHPDYRSYKKHEKRLKSGSGEKYFVMTSKSRIHDRCNARRISLSAKIINYEEPVFPVIVPAGIVFSKKRMDLAAEFSIAMLYAFERGITEAAKQRAELHSIKVKGLPFCPNKNAEKWAAGSKGTMSLIAIRRVLERCGMVFGGAIVAFVLECIVFLYFREPKPKFKPKAERDDTSQFHECLRLLKRIQSYGYLEKTVNVLADLSAQDPPTYTPPTYRPSDLQ